MDAAAHRDPANGRSGTPARRRVRPVVLTTAARSMTALFGGYALASAVATLIARLLPVDRADATAWGMNLSFLGFAGIALWCFHEPRVARVMLLVWGGTAALVPALYLLGMRP